MPAVYSRARIWEQFLLGHSLTEELARLPAPTVHLPMAFIYLQGGVGAWEGTPVLSYHTAVFCLVSLGFPDPSHCRLLPREWQLQLGTGHSGLGGLLPDCAQQREQAGVSTRH